MVQVSERIGSTAPTQRGGCNKRESDRTTVRPSLDPTSPHRATPHSASRALLHPTLKIPQRFHGKCLRKWTKRERGRAYGHPFFVRKFTRSCLTWKRNSARSVILLSRPDPDRIHACFPNYVYRSHVIPL